MAIIESMVGEGLTVEYIERCVQLTQDAGDEVTEVRLHPRDWLAVWCGGASTFHRVSPPGMGSALMVAGVPLRQDITTPEGEVAVITRYDPDRPRPYHLGTCPSCATPLTNEGERERCHRCGFEHHAYVVHPLPEPDRSAPIYHYDPELGF